MIPDRIKKFFNQPPSALTLVIVNLFPIYGIIEWGWEVFPVMFLFWSENIFIGIFNVLKMLTSCPHGILHFLGKLFFCVFFTIHYGMFTAGHGLFVMALFGQEYFNGDNFLNPTEILNVIMQFNLHIALIAMFLSHAFSFFFNFIRRGEYKQATPQGLMTRPYARILIMHVTLIAGGFLIMILEAPLAALLLFIILKTILDLRAHLKEHKAG